MGLALHGLHFLAPNSEKSGAPDCLEGTVGKVGSQNITLNCSNMTWTAWCITVNRLVIWNVGLHSSSCLKLHMSKAGLPSYAPKFSPMRHVYPYVPSPPPVLRLARPGFCLTFFFFF